MLMLLATGKEKSSLYTLRSTLPAAVLEAVLHTEEEGPDSCRLVSSERSS